MWYIPVVLWRHLWRYRINANIKTWFPRKPHILAFTLIPSSFLSDHYVKLYGWMCITFQMPLVYLDIHFLYHNIYESLLLNTCKPFTVSWYSLSWFSNYLISNEGVLVNLIYLDCGLPVTLFLKLNKWSNCLIIIGFGGTHWLTTV